jgi:RimJ/RimL family protein N-acetyltransferase
MKTKLQEESFEYYWMNFIGLLENLAFKELHFHKIFTYAFDLRPHLYTVLQKCGFIEEARLSEHCYFDGKYIDVVIHSKIPNNVEF